MSDASQPKAKGGRSVRLRAAAIAAAAFLAVAVIVHLPAFRSIVLRYALRTLETNFGVHADVRQLDYNLAALRIGLTGVRVARSGSSVPFFEADRVSAAFPFRVLLGTLSVDAVAIDKGLARIVLNADGSSNLPATVTGQAGEPAALPVGRFDAPRFRVDVRDQSRGLQLQIPSVSLHVEPDTGRIAADAPIELTIGDVVTRISRLEGGVSFDGRDLKVAALQIQSAVGRINSDGVIALLRREPSFRLDASGDVDTAAAARLAGLQESPRGTVAFTARASGAFAAPSADVQLTSPAVSWRQLRLEGLAAHAVATAGSLTIDRASTGFAGGRVEAGGVIPFDPNQTARIDVTWSDLDSASVTDALVTTAIGPAGRVSGELHGRGPTSDWRAWGADGLVILADAANRRGRISLPGESRLRVADRAWRIEARHVLAGVAPVVGALTGRIGDGPPASWPLGGTLELQPTNVPRLLRTLNAIDPSVPVDAIAKGTIRAETTITGTTSAPRAAFVTRGDSFVAAGQDIATLEAAGRWDGSVVRVATLRAAQRGTAAGTVSGSAAYTVSSGTYHADISTTGWVLTPADDLPVGGLVDAQLRADGRGRAVVADGNVTVRSTELRGIRVGDVATRLHVEGDRAHLETQIPEFDATAEGDVGLQVPYVATITAGSRRLDLARVLRDVPTPAVIDGIAAVRLEASGPLATWRDGRAAITIDSFDGRAGGVKVRLSAPASARYSEQRIAIDRLEAEAGATRVAASGSLPAFASSTPTTAVGGDAEGIVITATGDLGEAIEAAAGAGLFNAPIDRASGPLALLARAVGSVEMPRLTADLEFGPGSVSIRSNVPPVTDIRLRAHLEEDQITLREASARYQGASLTADGRVPVGLLTGAATPAGAASLHARATGLTPSTLRPFVDDATLEQLDGQVDASLDLTSTSADLATVQGEARLDRFELSLAGLRVTQRVPTRINVANGFARIDAWQWQGDGGNLEVRGQIRLQDRQAAILANGNIDLRILTPFVRDAGLTTSGRLEPRLSVTGTLDAPRVDGDITMTSGELRLNDPRVIIADVNARAVLSRTAAHLTAIDGTINGGALKGSGDLDYTFGPPEGGPYVPGASQGPQLGAHLSTAITGMALEFPPGLRSELNSELDISMTGIGTPMPSGQISGTVTIVRGAYRQPLPVVTGLLNSLKTRRATSLFEPSPLLDALALDVRIVTDDDLVVGNNVARLQLGADLRVIGTVAAPAISGRADLRSGGELFLGRNVYTLQLGTINFDNPTAIDPDLNVRATTRAGGESIEITMTGTPETLSAELRSTSDTALGQADIASLLLTGRRLDELASGQASAIGAQLLGNLSGDVLGFASRAVGLDVLRLGGVDTDTRRDPSAVATEIDPTSRLTFGKSIGRKMDVTFSQSLRDGDAQTWIVDYLTTRQLALRFVSDDDDLRSYEFRHDVSFGGGAVAKSPALSITPVTAATEPPRVTAVTFHGELRLPEKDLRDRLRLTVGKRFDFSEWQDDRDRLQQLFRAQRRFAAQIKATRQERPDGVTLDYLVDAGPETRIEVIGVELDPGSIRAIESAWSDSAFDGFLVDEARDIVTRALAARGFLRAVVKPVLRNEPGVRTLTIEVNAGTRTEATSVRVTVDDESLRGELETVVTGAGVEASAVANPAAVERTIADFLHSRGYSRAQVKAGAPLFEGSTAVVPVTVESGPRFVVGTVTISGARTLPQTLLQETAALESGTPFTDAAIEDARARLQTLYRREAFSTARVSTMLQPVNSQAALDVTFTVAEGPRQVVGDVVVAGNRSIDADVITRALNLAPGQPLRAEDWLKARRNIFDTGLFRRVDATTEASPSSGDASTAPMRIRVTVEEWPALRLRYGVQVAEERPEDNPTGRDLVPGLTADVTRQTLFGRPITTGGAVNYQRRERSARAFLSTPTLFSAPIRSGLNVELSREEFTAATFITERRAVSWEQRLRAGKHLDLSYTYRFERNHTFDTEALPGSELGFDVTVNIARLTAAAAWDTRDDAVDSTRGSLVSFTFDDAPESLGSGIRFIRQLTQAYTFRPWRGVVLASAARFGIVQALGDQELIPSVRFFAGGARTVRGFVEDSLGPRDFFGDAAGGETLLVLNQEVRFPLHKWLKGVTFIDAGNVFAKPRELSLRKLETAVGVGLRLATPFALLRVDYGQRLRGDAVERGGRLVFGIGQSF